MPSFSWTLASPPALVDAGGGVSLAGAQSASSAAPTRRDFLLGADGDLDLESGDVQWAEDLAAIAQEALLSVSQIAGEWFQDLDDGIPLFEEVLVENPILDRIRQLYRERLLTVTGIASVRSVELTFDRPAREAELVAYCPTDLGELRLAVNLP